MTSDPGIAATAPSGVAAILSPATLAAFDQAVIGRRPESEVLLAALAAGRHVMLEGPPGTGKSTLLRTLADAAGVDLVFVEGSAELTPGRLIGSHDPSRLLAEGYRDENFLDGPLVQAMRSGALLYLEELNRVPEETINVLITVMSEGELHVPRLGLVRATPGFALVAAMNPFDAVGTARISAAVYDRTCRIRMDYQSAADEERVVERAVHTAGVVTGSGPASRERLDIAPVVALVRATRSHPDIRIGSSVRGAIDMMLVANRLAALRGVTGVDPDVSLAAALAALTGRIRVQEGADRSPEEIITELWHRVFDPPAPADPAAADPAADAETDPGKAAGATGHARPAPLVMG